MSAGRTGSATAQKGGIKGDKDRQDALAQMDIITILRSYIHSMTEEAVGYKAMLFDEETMRAVSLLYGRTEFGEHNVVHIERLDSHDNKQHQELKAVCFLRPTRENVNLLRNEMKNPRYQSYYVFFTNLLSNFHLQELAEADAAHEHIQQIQEYYGDFIAVDPHHFVIPTEPQDLGLIISPYANTIKGSTSKLYEITDRYVQGLSALFLSVRRRPVIRFQAGSDLAQKLADNLYNLTYKQQYQVFDFGSRSNPVVLILDRRDDPVTPLLTQWTYQAMVHELMGIEDNIVCLPSAKSDPAKGKLVFDHRCDDFYRKHMYANFGDVGSSVKSMMESFQSTQAQHSKVETLDDMRKFITEHADFNRLQTNVAKHVNVVAELSDIVKKRSLFDVSTTEQELANPSSSLTQQDGYDEVVRCLRNPIVLDKEKIRLAMLFALRFEESSSQILSLLDMLVTAGVRDREPRLYEAVNTVLRAAGMEKRAGDLYGSRNLLIKARQMMNRLRDVENVYTQHTPLLSETMQQLSSSLLNTQTYPYMGTQDEAQVWSTSFKRTPPREAIIFIVGGTTYEEAKAVAEWNEKNPGMRVILGGSAVLNSSTYLSALTAGCENVAK